MSILCLRRTGRGCWRELEKLLDTRVVAMFVGKCH